MPDPPTTLFLFRSLLNRARLELLGTIRLKSVNIPKLL